MDVLQRKLLQPCNKAVSVSVLSPSTEGGMLFLILIMQRQHAHSTPCVYCVEANDEVCIQLPFHTADYPSPPCPVLQ